MVCGCRLVSMDAREGAHSANPTWNRVNFSDSSANEQMCGVCSFPDVVPITSVHAVSGRRSSAIIRITSRALCFFGEDGIADASESSDARDVLGTLDVLGASDAWGSFLWALCRRRETLRCAAIAEALGRCPSASVGSCGGAPQPASVSVNMSQDAGPKRKQTAPRGGP